MKVYGFELTEEMRVDVNEMMATVDHEDGDVGPTVPSYKRTEIVLIVLQRTG